MRRLQVVGARIVDPAAGRDAVGDVAVEDGFLTEAGGKAVTLDGRGLLLLPGLLDVHVHFRDPGDPAAGNLAAGARAAARGGFTRVVTMPNTCPPCDTPELVRRQIDADLDARVLPAACLTRGRRGAEVADLATLAAAGAVAFTDDGSMVVDDAVMAAAMRLACSLGRPVLDHALDPRLAGEGIIRDSPLARRLALPLLDPRAESSAVRRDIRLARETGCALHVQHVSCAESLAAIRAAQREGLPVTAEATPHHLLLAADEIVADDGNLRMSPPLGSRADREALRAAVLDGTVAVLATDHAPHPPATKARGYAQAPPGVIGLETAVAATWQALVLEEGMPPAAFAACWTTAPARLLGLPPPTLAPGRPADLVLLDFETPWVVRPERFAGQARNCPFAGMTMRGRARLTFREGRMTWLDPDWPGAKAVRQHHGQ